MSYFILRDLRFVDLVDGNKLMLQRGGDNNSFSISRNGREISEDEWGVSRNSSAPQYEYGNYKRFLINDSNINGVIEIMRSAVKSGCVAKSRYKSFEEAEIERKIRNAYKKPIKLEDILGNQLIVFVYDDINKKTYRISTKSTIELLGILKNNYISDIKFSDNKFKKIEDFNKPIKKLSALKEGEVYIIDVKNKNIKTKGGEYYISPNSYTTSLENSNIKTFTSLEEAQKTIDCDSKFNSHQIKKAKFTTLGYVIKFNEDDLNRKYFVKKTSKGIYHTPYENHCKVFSSKNAAQKKAESLPSKYKASLVSVKYETLIIV